MIYKKLSEEDKIIIKYLRQKFGYGAKRIIKDHPEKNWGFRNVGYLLKKVDKTCDVKRREESGRPKSSRTENNINAVKELISSQEDKPGTHAKYNRVFPEQFISYNLTLFYLINKPLFEHTSGGKLKDWKVSQKEKKPTRFY